MSDPHAEDKGLMQRIAAGEAAALDTLYDRHAGLVMAVCLAVLRDRTEAEEVVGDTFFELWRRRHRYDPARGHPMAYLVTLARSRAIDRARKLGRRRSAELAVEKVPEPRQPGALLATPLADSLATERRLALEKALASLEAGQRALVELSFLRGLSHGEIAEQTGQPLGTVKTRIRRGLLRLRDALTDPTARGGSS